MVMERLELLSKCVNTTEYAANDKDSRVQKGMNLFLRSLQIFHFSIIVQSKPHANNLLYFCFTFASTCFISYASVACFIFALRVL